MFKKLMTVLFLFAVVFNMYAGGRKESFDPHAGGSNSVEAIDGIPLTVLSEDFEYPIQYSEREWKTLLKDNFAYNILRNQGTERPWTNEYNENKVKGIYYSAATGQPLFSSEAKYDSRTGWPSFWEPIDPDAVHLLGDYSHGMLRVEVVDSLSGSHLGHLFPDGPDPTGLRYCMNSASMIFVPEGGDPPVITLNN